MNAVQTRFLPPINSRGTRVKAMADGVPAKTYVWDYALNVDANHVRAAVEFAKLRNWLPKGRTLRSGTLPNGDMCHVLPSRSTGRTINRAALHRLLTAANRVAELFDHCPDDETAAEAGLELERAAAAIGE